MRLVDASKVLKFIEESPLAKGFWGGPNAILAFDNLTDAMDRGDIDPDPVLDIRPGGKVTHDVHPEWGTGEVLAVSGCEAWVQFENRPYSKYYRTSKLTVVGT